MEGKGYRVSLSARFLLYLLTRRFKALAPAAGRAERAPRRAAGMCRLEDGRCVAAGVSAWGGTESDEEEMKQKSAGHTQRERDTHTHHSLTLSKCHTAYLTLSKMAALVKRKCCTLLDSNVLLENATLTV